MLLSLRVLLFLCGSRAAKASTSEPKHTSFGVTSIPASTSGGTLTSLQLLATPDYPVATGQAVVLQCSMVSGSASYTASFTWVWQHLENNTWNVVSNGTDLTLTKPNDSGLYRCLAANNSSQWAASRNHTVFIVAVLQTEEALGVAALVVSLLALFISVAVLFCLGCQKYLQTLPVSDIPNGVHELEKTPKRQPQTEYDDVYVNYRVPNCPYTDLDPAKMTVAGIYSTLS